MHSCSCQGEGDQHFWDRIRMALGASRAGVSGHVLREGMRLVVVGIVLGLGLSLLGARMLEGFVFGVTATDPLTLTLVSLTVAVAALLACYVPARTAAAIDPAIAMRD